MWQDAHIPLAYYYQEHPDPETTKDTRMEEPYEEYSPNVERMFHEGELPNLLNYIPYCNYWRQTKKKKNFTFIEALIWLISKAIPWRCNVRAIRNTFTQDCLPDHPNIYQIIVSFLTCSMLGAYRHAKYAPCFTARIAIYGFMIFKPVDRGWMIWWFQQPENQSVLQNIIREFIVFATSNIPPLRQAMIERHRWNLVEDSCYKAMDEFRQHLDRVHSKGSVHWFKDIKEILADFDTYHLKLHGYKPNPRLFIEKMAEECTNFDDEMFGNPAYRQELFTEEETKCLQDMIMRVPKANNRDPNDPIDPKDQIPFYLLSATEEIPVPHKTASGKEILINLNKNPFETDHVKMRKLTELMIRFYSNHDTKPLGEFLKTLTVYEYQKISCFFYFLREQQTVRVRVLPMHYYIYQLKALCKKHHVSTPAQIPPGAGQYYYSIYCGFKGFIVPPEGPKQRTSNLLACGSHEAMYSFDKGEVFCFHKVNKSKRRKQNPRKRTSIEMFSHFRETNFKRLSKDNRKQKMHSLCSRIPLRKISLPGFALECQEGLLTLCCNCANPAVFGINKFEADKFVCTRCTAKENLYNEITCVSCTGIQKEGGDAFTAVEVWDNVRKNPPEFATVHLCKKCNRKWISQGTTTHSLSVVLQGIKEKWRSHKLGNQCLAIIDPSAKKRRGRVRVSGRLSMRTAKATGINKKEVETNNLLEVPTTLPEPEKRRPARKRQ